MRFQWSTIVLSILVMIGIVLRMTDWGVWAVNPDEGIYWEAAKGNLVDLAWITHRHTHPPFYFVLLWFLGGVSTAVDFLRSPALVCSILLIPAVFCWLRGSLGVAGGLTAAGLVALSPEIVVQSGMIRPYPFLLLVLVGALVFQQRFVLSGNGRDLAACGTLWNLALSTHYSSALLLAVSAAANFYCADPMTSSNRKSLFKAHLAIAVIGAAIAWLFLTRHVFNMASGYFHPSEWMAPYYSDEAAGLAAIVDLQFDRMFGMDPGIGFHEILVVAGAGVLWKRHRALALSGLFGLALALVLAAFKLYPVGSGRHGLWLALAVVPCLAAVPGVLLFSKSLTGRVAGLVLAGVLIVFGVARHPAVDHEHVATRKTLTEILDWVDGSPRGRTVVTDEATMLILGPELDLGLVNSVREDGLMSRPGSPHRILIVGVWELYKLDGPDWWSGLGDDVWILTNAWNESRVPPQVGTTGLGATTIGAFRERTTP